VGLINRPDIVHTFFRSHRGRSIKKATPVGTIQTANGRVTGLATAQGVIDADVVIVAAGLWSRVSWRHWA
jgi:glycine/D-amino acid oxidase-like deaminating enzyme